MMNNEFRSGVVAVIGRPNAGKSSLMNRILRYRLSIVTPKPQTTRDNILGLYNGPASQILFVDTPGIHKPVDKLGERLVERAVSELEEADVVLFVITIDDKPAQSENLRIIEHLKKCERPVILAINKIDLPGSKTRILPLIDAYSRTMAYSEVLPISARDGTNCDTLVGFLEKLLPVAAPMYPDDVITDRPERFIAQEVIREKVMSFTEEEIPHSVAVEIDEYKSPDEYPERKDLFIRATVYVEREGQKAIVLGKRGAMIKAVGTAARKALQELTGYKTYLELWVKVNKGWRESETELKRLGYE